MTTSQAAPSALHPDHTLPLHEARSTPDPLGPQEVLGPQDALQEGIDAAKAGNRVLARLHFEETVTQNRDHIDAWLWLAWTADSPAAAANCLEQVLSRRPRHVAAAWGMAWARAMNEFTLFDDGALTIDHRQDWDSPCHQEFAGSLNRFVDKDPTSQSPLEHFLPLATLDFIDNAVAAIDPPVDVRDPDIADFVFDTQTPHENPQSDIAEGAEKKDDVSEIAEVVTDVQEHDSERQPAEHVNEDRSEDQDVEIELVAEVIEKEGEQVVEDGAEERAVDGVEDQAEGDDAEEAVENVEDTAVSATMTMENLGKFRTPFFPNKEELGGASEEDFKEGEPSLEIDVKNALEGDDGEQEVEPQMSETLTMEEMKELHSLNSSLAESSEATPEPDQQELVDSDEHSEQPETAEPGEATAGDQPAQDASSGGQRITMEDLRAVPENGDKTSSDNRDFDGECRQLLTVLSDMLEGKEPAQTDMQKIKSLEFALEVLVALLDFAEPRFQGNQIESLLSRTYETYVSAKELKKSLKGRVWKGFASRLFSPPHDDQEKQACYGELSKTFGGIYTEYFGLFADRFNDPDAGRVWREKAEEFLSQLKAKW